MHSLCDAIELVEIRRRLTREMAASILAWKASGVGMAALGFDVTGTLEFHDRLRAFHPASASPILMVALEPDPIEYCKGSGSVNAHILTEGDTAEDYLAALNASPADSPADSLMDRADEMAIVPMDLSWAAVASRLDDVTLFSIRSEQMHLRFKSAFFGWEKKLTSSFIETCLPNISSFE